MLTDNRGINTTRGVRNNNPMNLRKGIAFQYQIENPKETAFMTFGKTWQGIRAGVLDITNDISKGQNTLTKLINQYAPPNENDTTGYINNISKNLAIKPSDILDRKNFDFMVKLVKSIIVMENGANALKFITDQDINEGVKSAFVYRAYKLPEATAKKPDTGAKTELISLFVGVVVVLFLLKFLIK